MGYSPLRSSDSFSVCLRTSELSNSLTVDFAKITNKHTHTHTHTDTGIFLICHYQVLDYVDMLIELLHFVPMHKDNILSITLDPRGLQLAIVSGNRRQGQIALCLYNKAKLWRRNSTGLS